MKIKIVALILVLSVALCGCEKDESSINIEGVETYKPEYRVDNKYYDALNMLVNNELLNDTNEESIQDLVSLDVLSNIKSNMYNYNSDMTINNVYYTNDCIFVQASNSNKDIMYKVKVSDDKIVSCMEYNLVG